jgi:hypothetical protein
MRNLKQCLPQTPIPQFLSPVQVAALGVGGSSRVGFCSPYFTVAGMTPPQIQPSSSSCVCNCLFDSSLMSVPAVSRFQGKTVVRKIEGKSRWTHE